MPFPFISPLLLLNNPFSSDVNSLFHVVVENDDISTKIIQVLTREKGGRVTFIPLNRVHAPNVNVPQSSDFVPLLKKLKFRPDHRRAFEQVSFKVSFNVYIFYWDTMANLVQALF
jgi:hypothetical protein